MTTSHVFDTYAKTSKDDTMNFDVVINDNDNDNDNDLV